LKGAGAETLAGGHRILTWKATNMILSRKPRPHVLIAAGLLGITLYAVVVRVSHPAVLANDFLQGAWYGACLGLELLGLYLLRKPGARHAA
jgi:hypothetical protein